MLNIETFIFNPFQENTYLLWDDDSCEAMLVDPGMSNDMEISLVDTVVENNSLKVKYIVNTHCHIDHTFGNYRAVEKYNAPLLVPKEDELLLENMPTQANIFGLDYKQSPEPDDYLDPAIHLFLGEFKIEIIKTPGHSPGGTCLYNAETSICITGDTLFREGIGRTDLWGGSYDTLIESIKTKLFQLPDNVKIFPGHGDTSTIGFEKASNPFIL